MRSPLPPSEGSDNHARKWHGLLIVCGIATNFGVEATVRDAFASNYAAIVAEDETSTFISASFAAHIDASGCIVMDRKDA